MATREDLHRLIDELDASAIPDALTELSKLSQRNSSHDERRPPARRPLSFIGAFSSGEGDLAARSADILRDELGRAEH